MIRHLTFPLAVFAVFAALALWIRPERLPLEAEARKAEAVAARLAGDDELSSAIAVVDSALAKQWRAAGLEPAGPVDDLTFARRLSLALTATIPSLEELRLYESLTPERRRTWYLDRLLRDPRTHASLAERWTRATVGVDEGAFLVYRRRRYRAWLAAELKVNRPFDEIVRAMIASDGLWTDKPATNFVTATVNPNTDRPDPVRLAGRVSKAFLGVRMDCAECHDHPFESWTQEDFHGLAAFFGQARTSGAGVWDDAWRRYTVKDRKSLEDRAYAPGVPFAEELLPPTPSVTTAKPAPEPPSSAEKRKRGFPSTERRRRRLAKWVTDPRNGAFARAIVNRMVAILIGRPLVEPVDDIPTEGPWPAPLAELAEDFAGHGYDLRRLITMIVLSDLLGLDSRTARPVPEEAELLGAVFPLTRLRPEQVVRSLLQAGSTTTLDRESWWLAQLISFGSENDFLKRYGDIGEDRFESSAGTLPQRLLLMNGKISRDRLKGELGLAFGQIAALSPTNREALDNLWLAVLTRRPTEPEIEHFLPRLEGVRGKARERAVADLVWPLVNSTEFSWNH